MEPTKTPESLKSTEEYPNSPMLTHTRNTAGNLGMFVNPENCSCPTCVDHCKPKTQKCWGCEKQIPYNKDEPYCSWKCECEDDERDREHRACCSGCYNYHDDEDESQKTQDYPSDEEEEEEKEEERCFPDCVQTCPNCHERIYGLDYCGCCSEKCFYQYW